MAVSALAFSSHHSLYELMTLEKSSIGPRLKAATPLTWWKHAFSPCRNVGLHICVRAFASTKRNTLIICEMSKEIQWLPLAGISSSLSIDRARWLDIEQDPSSRAVARCFTRRGLIPSEMPRSGWLRRFLVARKYIEKRNDFCMFISSFNHGYFRMFDAKYVELQTKDSRKDFWVKQRFFFLFI